MGMPAKIRLSALIDGLVLPDSMSEILAFATPAFLANARCDKLKRKRTIFNLKPTSISISLIHLFNLTVKSVKYTITLKVLIAIKSVT